MDGQLLERFLQQHDHTAFEHLVRVHGPMVYGVCRRILLNHHDAEEAFQATFLVLARKAKSLTARSSVAGWLHETAQRTALNARRLRAQRRVRELSVENLPEPPATSQDHWPEIAPVLDLELSRLPEKYRAAIVLCDLEGKGQEVAAAELGCSRGTLSSRLVRARALLQKRLSRLGVTVSLGSLAMTLSHQAAAESMLVPAELLVSTVHAVNVWTTGSAAAAGVISPQVAALTEGVLKTMFLSTLKNVVAAVTLIAVAGLGAGGLIYPMLAAEPAGKAQDMKEVLEKLHGNWKAVRVEEKGERSAESKVQARRPRMEFTDTKWRLTLQEGNEERTLEATMKIDTDQQPFEIDLSDVIDPIGGRPTPPGMAMTGIFQFQGDKLKLRLKGHQGGKDSKGNLIKRPQSLDATEPRDANDPVDVLWTLERVTP